MLVELLITFTDGHRTEKIMTTKPEFTKPFDIDSAKAGAPYCCRDGHPAKVLKWDRNVSDYPLLGVIRKSDDPRTWAITGSTTYGNHGAEYDCDLVMLPLCMIDGRPVFVGDELVTRFGDKFVVSAKHIGDLCEENTWPAPAPVYPETRLTEEELAIAANGGRFSGLIPVPFHVAAPNIANAALRHAIDAGQVVLPGDTAARDMAVAVAVAVAVNNAAAKIALKAHFAFELDLPTIIAGVAK